VFSCPSSCDDGSAGSAILSVTALCVKAGCFGSWMRKHLSFSLGLSTPLSSTHVAYQTQPIQVHLAAPKRQTAACWQTAQATKHSAQPVEPETSIKQARQRPLLLGLLPTRPHNCTPKSQGKPSPVNLSQQPMTNDNPGGSACKQQALKAQE
jgi:hypothetical protein